MVLEALSYISYLPAWAKILSVLILNCLWLWAMQDLWDHETAPPRRGHQPPDHRLWIRRRNLKESSQEVIASTIRRKRTQTHL